MQIDERLLWVDVETTGLDPCAEGAAILEVAMIVTGPGLVEEARRKWLLREPGWRIDPAIAAMDEFVTKMHVQSGLMNDLTTGRVDDLDMRTLGDAAVSDFMSDCDAVGLKPAGSSVHFDRQWMLEHLPMSSKLLHSHRNFDVSTLRTAFPAEYEAFKAEWDSEFGGGQGMVKHRAMDDLETDLAFVRSLL